MSENNKFSKPKNIQSAFKNISAAVKGFLPTTSKQGDAAKADQKQTIQISATATIAGNKVGGSAMRNETSTNANLLGEEFRQAREELGYKFEDLTEHTGLSADEIEALELGRYDKIEQQDYIEYYVHNYATLLGLDSDLALEHYQRYIVPETTALQTAEAAPKFDIHDEQQYEDAFADEAKKTIEALEVSELTTLENYDHIEPEIDFSANQPSEYSEDAAPEIGDAGSAYIVGSINVSNLNDTQESPKSKSKKTGPAANKFTSLDGDNQYLSPSTNADHKSFPWLRIVAAGIFVVALAGSIYFMVNMQQSDDPANIASVGVATTDDATTQAEVKAPVVKKTGTLETKIIAKGNDDLNAATATMVQKPLIMRNQAAAVNNQNAATNTQGTANGETTAPTGASSAVKQSGTTSSTVEQSPAAASDEQVATNSIAKTDTATITDATSTNTAQSALDALPDDDSQFSLHATQNNWLLIEDDTSQILFSGELTPEKIFTLPKINGVIISLGNAGIIDVYRGKTLLGKLGKDDESLDLVSIETRLNLIAETANNSN